MVTSVGRFWPLVISRGMRPYVYRVAVKWVGVEDDCQRNTAIDVRMIV